MDDPSAAGTGTVDADADAYRPSRSYPYLSAVEDRRRRKRAGLVWLAIAVVLVVVLVTVVLLTGNAPTGPAPAEPAAAPTTAGPRSATSSSSTTSRPPTTGAEVVAAPAPTTAPPPPQATITVSAGEVACNEGAAETSTTLSWTSTSAGSATVGGPAGQISAQVQGEREVVPSRPCAEAPFEDVYTVSVSNGAGAASGQASVTWTANGVAEEGTD